MSTIPFPTEPPLDEPAININHHHPTPFPLELYDLIFTFLASDHDWPTLKTCALLSSTHLRLARAILFSSIALQLRHTPSTSTGTILIHDVVRRIQGLTDLLRRDPSTVLSVKRFCILDSYPVYDSQWITQQPSLPALISLLIPGVRNCTFGCSVGYLQWNLFSAALQASLLALFSSPNLEGLTLCNIGSVPTEVGFNVGKRVKFLGLNHVHMRGITMDYPPVVPRGVGVGEEGVRVMSVRTLSLQNTNAVWAIMQAHARGLRVVRWRCWEDPLARDGVCFPGRINLSLLPALHTLSLRISYAKSGRDLAGFCTLLESLSSPVTLALLTIAILFPLQLPMNWDTVRAGMGMREVYRSPSWGRLARALERRDVFGALRRVRMELTVHEVRGRWSSSSANNNINIGASTSAGSSASASTGMGAGTGGAVAGGQGTGTRTGRRRRTQNSLVVFRDQMKSTLRALTDISTFHFTYRVRAFDQRAAGEEMGV